MTTKHYNKVDLFAIAYLIIPFILFILGWIKPFIAYPLVAVLLLSLMYSLKGAAILPVRYDLIRKNTRHIITSVFILSVVLFLSGLTGNWHQHTDYGVRNDIFIDLITKSWPTPLEDGKYFIYYFQTWLPAALVGSLCGWKAAQWAYFLWILLGMLFVLYYTYKALNRISFWIVLLLVAWNGIELIPCSLIAPFTRGISCAEAFMENNHVAEPFVCFGPTFSLKSISHCFVPIAVICGMALQANIVRQWGVLLGVCAVLYSPMAAIFWLPCLVYLYLRAHRDSAMPINSKSFFVSVAKSLCSPLSLVSYILFAVVVAPYYLSADSASPVRLDEVTLVQMFALLFFLIWNVGIAAFLTRLNNKDNLLWVALGTHVLCMLASLCINNDMAMKGSAICNYYLLILFLQAAYNAPSKQKKWYIIYAVISANYAIHMVATSIMLVVAPLFYLFLHCRFRYQFLSVIAALVAIATLWSFKPGLFQSTIDKLSGSRVRYNKTIGIYQADGGSGRWWWYKTFPSKEDMPLQFKQY